MRPRRLVGRTYRIGTPLGTTFVTINENGEGAGQPFELFIHTSKAGSDTAAVSEAIGRLASLVLRMRSPILPRERLKEILVQLEGIGGGRAMGFGPSRVRSLPDGVAQILADYLSETEAELAEAVAAQDDQPQTPQIVLSAPYQHGNGNGKAPTTTTNGNGHTPVSSAVKPTAVQSALQSVAQSPAQVATQTATRISTDIAPGGKAQFTGALIGDLCPECGEATLVNEEGCRKCYSCGYSEC